MTLSQKCTTKSLQTRSRTSFRAPESGAHLDDTVAEVHHQVFADTEPHEPRDRLSAFPGATITKLVQPSQNALVPGTKYLIRLI
jgi:hypothetical protein